MCTIKTIALAAACLSALGGCATATDRSPVDAPAPPAVPRPDAGPTGPMSWSDVQAIPAPAPAPSTPIAYGELPEQFGELRLPPGEGPHPVAVLIHGGCWLQEFDYTYFRHLAAAITGELGIATWTIEYRRVGGSGGWPMTFLDVADALDHLRELAAEHPLDLRKVVVAGHSAGGHLALWSATRARLAPASDLYRSSPLPIHGVIGLAPITDLAAYRVGPAQSCHSAVDSLMGGTPATLAGRYADASPSQRLPTGAPIVLVSGAEDSIVPTSGVRSFVDAATAAGDRARIETVAGAGHFEPSVPGSLAWPAMRQAFDQLVGSAAAPELVSFATADGGIVYANLHGSGDHAVVLAHGGQFNKESWSEQIPALLDAGLRVLAIEASGDIEIDGVIYLADNSGSHALLIASWNGTVRINGRILSARTQRPPSSVRARHARVRGSHARTGGHVVISAPIIEINGRITGGQGMDGEVVTAIGDRWPFGGSAGAAGGPGGHGGHVLLCAEELIDISVRASITGGRGGAGGKATATADNGSYALARGGHAGHGGDVIFRGHGGATPTVQFASPTGRRATAAGGRGAHGGRGSATGGPSGFRGGDGDAFGGRGGKGGTVRFESVRVAGPGTQATSMGHGGGGGPAEANGGSGLASNFLSPGDGGQARARGGDAGPRGDESSFLLVNGDPGKVGEVFQTTFGPVTNGTGGSGTAKGGNGGTYVRGLPADIGGSSGKGEAWGGRNGAGQPLQPTSAVAPPVVPPGPAGAISTPASKKGAR